MCACHPPAVRRHSRTTVPRRLVNPTLHPSPQRVVVCACHPRAVLRHIVHRRPVATRPGATRAGATRPGATRRPSATCACHQCGKKKPLTKRHRHPRLLPAKDAAQYLRTHQVRSLCVKTSRVKVSANLDTTVSGHPARAHPQQKPMVLP
jgi:hypothetical protein